MKNSITIDRTGRVVIPKEVRDSLQLEPGDVLEINASDAEIILTPARGPSHLAKEDGVWVYRSGAAISRDSANRMIDDAREERIRELSRWRSF